jgi:hypothetical protein
MAKIKLKEWFDKSEKDDYKKIGDISFRSNRESGVFLDYPNCKNIKTEIIEFDIKIMNIMENIIK